MKRARAKALTLFLLALPVHAGTIVVNQTADPTTSDGLCSLREAMFAAGFNIAIDGCPAGDFGFDTIQLAPDTYLLRAPIGLTGIDPFLLAGSGPTNTRIQPEPGEPGRLFYFHDTASVTFQDLELRNANSWTSTVAGNGGAMRVVDADLTLRNVLFYGNRANAGGGLSFETVADLHELSIENSGFGFNRADEGAPSTGAQGGGLYLDLQGANSAVRIRDTTFAGNVATGTSSTPVSGGALQAQLAPEVSVEVTRSYFLQNRAESQGAQAIAGVSASIDVDSGLRIQDSAFYGNDVEGPAGSVTALSALVFGALTVERTSFTSEDQGEAHRHVGIASDNSAGVSLRSLLLAEGPATGIVLVSGLTDYVELGHLTVTQHAQIGIALEAYGPTRIENSILWQNGVNLQSDGPVSPTLTADLIGIDPLFVEAGSYELAANSPAVDTGSDTVLVPTFLDLLHRPRKVGIHTDKGALERRGIFADDFGSGDLGFWTLTLP
jgi:CSLREA domain-containing protein